MKNITQISSMVIGCMFVLTLMVGMPAIASAQAFDEGCCDYSYDWGDSDSSYSWGSGDASYNWGDSDSSYDWGNGDTSYNWGDDSSYNWGSGDTSYSWGESDSSYNWGDPVYEYEYQRDPLYEYEYQADPVYAYEYEADCDCYHYDRPIYDSECACYSYTSSSGSAPRYSTGSYSVGGYSSGGYSMVKPMTFGSPSYPTYNPPAKSTGGSSSVSNISNTTITNVDNSIKDSFNNYNSNNVSYVVPATPQYPVVNVQPGPYCQIYQTQATGSGVTAVYLSWTSSNATSAYLSNVGGVSVNGSKTVWPTGSQSYTLTVYGYNGQTATCHANVNTAPYVSLTQIPYTGFDFGTFGNAMYWAGLATFALGAGYLAIYYVPALAIAGMGTRKQYAPVVAPKAPILVEREAVAEKLAPIVNSVRKAGTFDTMAIVSSKDGSMPKIVIDRS